MLFVLILLGIVIVILCGIVLLFVSTIKIKIKNLHIENATKAREKRYQLIITLVLGKRWTILKKELSSEQIRKIYETRIKEKLNLRKIEKSLWKEKKETEILKVIKTLKISIEKLDLKLNIGTEDAILTSYITAGLASTIGIIYPHVIKQENRKQCHFFVNPVYQNRNLYDIRLEIKVAMKVISLLKSIFLLTKVS